MPEASDPHVEPAERGSTGGGALTLLLGGYLLLLAYGSLFPLVGWRPPLHDPLQLLRTLDAQALGGSQLALNLLVYIPLGLLLGIGLGRRLGTLPALILVTMAGATFSLSMELLQAYLPARQTSGTDLAANTLGTLAGALLERLARADTPPGRVMRHWRRNWLLPGLTGDLATGALILWLLAELVPFAPGFTLETLRTGLLPVERGLLGVAPVAWHQALSHALELAGLGLLLYTVGNRWKPWPLAFMALAGAALLLKIPVLSRALTLEALIGLATAGALLALLTRANRKSAALLACALLLAGAAAGGLGGLGIEGAPNRAFNWTPFRGHLPGVLGLAGILESLWPYLAAGCALRSYSRHPGLRRWLAIGGGLLVLVLTGAVELAQTGIPGRYPDVTDIALPLMGWAAAWYRWRTGSSERARVRPLALRPLGLWAPQGIILLTAAGLLGASVVFGPTGEAEQGPSTTPAPEFPEPSDLTPVSLPGFRHEHPRLPAPSASDIERLRAENPGYLERHRERASGGAGNLYSVTLTAFLDPGSQDLGRLHERLMALEYDWRGHQQAKPIALAYDWLHDQWTAEQRAQLQDKLVEGGEYLIGFIREQRLSPYNVYLYNSPFQALVAVALAGYGDTPRADPIMRFTQDLWEERVLPVWRQVMGENGGWHEGGEYVGIGIGQAIYQVPAMWRSATGEDFFASEPGIRGFLDFLVYRKRPDGTDFRWGDAGHFNNRVPDRVPLALEYGHAAAYSLGNRPRIEPTAWPWGPLPRPELYDPDAVRRLPWARLFDGLGLVVARSDWSGEATYVTFKAGDNYWSHSHLDQGAFTIYKGGPLAIDSGLYGPKYNSDHHMNYTYQAIAHNVVTVTDPDDTVHAPPRKDDESSRRIANDGGQRRIGSGWGVEAAPIDLAEWQAKREIYETGDILHHRIEEDYLYVVADLTAAYTNALSGDGTFSHRTRRVERFLRTFIYDRRSGAVIVYDRVRATDPDFRKRWLLHCVERPEAERGGFEVFTTGTGSPGRGGGRMPAEVLLPEGANVNPIGGRGFEFFVEDRNYDADGEVQRIVEERKPDAEPGSWRIEVSPGIASRETRFLVVMFPRLAGEADTPEVTRIEQPDRLAVELRSPDGGTTHWWLIDDREQGVRVRVARDDTPR
ncbi:VanZ family protein [Spiribacter halobius]|uniref:Heparinase n=1 Tax=Sediminicurvatus halobius TaxID=2182432 RepID=A0A2U2MX67_9GAMM|nr:VanZ family protein [Spiribacter halobius]PWG61458.1 heparinase [Spiribacter halobius]UEX77243.1 VanZ family protein [Spiribacter halobius]